MRCLDQNDIRRALVNVTKSERAAVTFAPDFSAVPWDKLDFYGWRDPKFPQRGYLVRDHPADGLIAVGVRAPEAGMAGRRKAMCSLCQAVDAASAVALFSARRTGQAGRKGDSVGTYICAGLDCSAQLRVGAPRAGRSMLSDRALDPEQVAAAMLARLDSFLTTVDVGRASS